jgi:hypothetical protein
MESEYVVIEIVQSAAGDFGEIGYIILVEPGISHPLVLAMARY